MKLEIFKHTTFETTLVSGDKRIAEVKHYSEPAQPFIVDDYLIDPERAEGWNNAQRIVDCVNALDGIDDVFEFVKKAKQNDNN
jgi:hypothetical protein